MELKGYWEIVRRRAWIVVVLTVLAFVASVGVREASSTTYLATMRLAVKPQIEQTSSTFYTYDEYYSYVASEYLVDDIIEIIESNTFRQQLLDQLKGKIASLPNNAIKGKKSHRVLIVSVSAATRDAAQIAAETIGTMLQNPNNQYFGSLSSQNPVVTIVDQPQATEAAGENRKYIDIGLRTLLGFLAGLGLVFLLDYLDGTILGAHQVEQLIGLPVLGEIPQQKRALLGR